MVKHHDLDWDDAVELKSQYRTYSEPKPQTDPKACTTAAQLCLHHDWDPSKAKYGIKKMKKGLIPYPIADMLDVDTPHILDEYDFDSE